MLIQSPIRYTWLAALLMTFPAYAVDISQCWMVAEDRAEIITFDARRDNGTDVTLSAILASPEGTGPFPAIVMLHGGGALFTPYCYGAFVEKFVNWGYVVLIPASTSARDRTGTTLLNYSFLDQVHYAHGAAAALRAKPQVDPGRIGVWGHSRGGLSVLHGVSGPEGRFDSVFRSAVAVAPQCPATATQTKIPLLVIVGTHDRQVSVEACIDFAALLKSAPEFEFVMLSSAGHSYWAPSVPGYIEAAAKLAEERLKNFLTSYLQVKP